MEEGTKIIESGDCQEGALLASPDVFFGRVCYDMEQRVQTDLWTEYTRNSLDCHGHLDEARQAYRDGIDIIHGVKTQEELDYILG